MGRLIGFRFLNKKEEISQSNPSFEAVNDILLRMAEVTEIVKGETFSEETIGAIVTAFIEREQQNIQFFANESEDHPAVKLAGLATTLSAFAYEMAVLEGAEGEDLEHYHERFMDSYSHFIRVNES